MSKKYDSDIVGWITRGGKRIPLRKGEGHAVGKRKAPNKSWTDADNFDDFVNANIADPQFLEFGRAHGSDAVKLLWLENKRNKQIADAQAVDIESAVNTLRANLSQNILDGWFREANSEYKPALLQQILTGEGVLNAGLNVAYYNYAHATDNPLPFETWLTTPVKMYRGGNKKQVKDDLFTSYTPDKEIAEKFGEINDEIIVRPIDTLGSYQTTAEQEYLVMKKRKNNGQKVR